MLGARTGKLFISTRAAKKYEIHLREGMILSLKDDGFSVLDTVALRHRVTDLLGLRAGKFEFSQVPLNQLAHEVSFNRQEIWQIVATLEPSDEGLGTEHIPDQATRFKLKSGFKTEVKLPDDLRDFLQRSHDLLFSGCSATELASALRLSVPQVQIYFQRLRSLDRITPVRAYAANYGSYNAVRMPVAAVEATAPSVYSRPTSATTAVKTASNSTAKTPVAQATRPKQGLIQRLLSVFSFGGK